MYFKNKSKSSSDNKTSYDLAPGYDLICYHLLESTFTEVLSIQGTHALYHLLHLLFPQTRTLFPQNFSHFRPQVKDASEVFSLSLLQLYFISFIAVIILWNYFHFIFIACLFLSPPELKHQEGRNLTCLIYFIPNARNITWHTNRMLNKYLLVGRQGRTDF